MNSDNAFYEKFKNQIENLGKDGVVGIMKTTDKSEPIQSYKQIQQPMGYYQPMQPPFMSPPMYNYYPQYQNQMYNPMANNGAYILYNTPKPQTQPAPKFVNNNNNFYPFFQNQFFLPNQFYGNNMQQQVQPQRQFNNFMSTNIKKIANNTNYEYKPYTLKEYKEINRVPITLGKLGPNIGTEEWEEKKKKMNRLKEYSKQVNKKKSGLIGRNHKLKEEIEKEKQTKIENSHRNRSLKYGQLIKEQVIHRPLMIDDELSHKDTQSERVQTHPIQRSKTDNLPPIITKNTIHQEEPTKVNEDIEKKEDNLEFLISKNNHYQNEIAKIKESLLK